jgi:ribose/xylose/arabinose/galactoside ABC-type transport system permease subunit
VPQAHPKAPLQRRAGLGAGLRGALPGRSRRGRRSEGRLEILFVPVILAALLLWLSLSAHGFLETDNVTNILLQGSMLGIVAFGMTFVILAGELDLSVGSGVALVSVVSALVMRDTGSVLLGVVAGIATGVALGVVNGLVVTRLEVPSFIATLGTLVIAHGIALSLTNGAVIGDVPESIGNLTSDRFLGVRWLIWLLVAVFVALYLLQRKTTFGVKVMSVGGNREAARLSAVNVDRVRFLCFVLVGATVGIAGVALTSRVQSGQPNAGSLLALTAIAAVIVGGTSLTGGRGTVFKTLWGVLLLAVLDNGLDVKGVDPDLKQVVIGGVFIAAASVDFIQRRLRTSSAQTALSAERAHTEDPARAPVG